jgi:hypothetical protein
MNPEEKSLYAEMRASIRGDRERAEKRAEKRRSQQVAPSPALSESADVPRGDVPRHQGFARMRRLFGGSAKQS